MIRSLLVRFPGVLVVAGVMACTPAPGPTASDAVMLASETTPVLAAAREIIAAARFASMVTLGPDGHPQARVVDPFAPDSMFAVMVATKPQTRKVAAIASDARVTLLYFDAAGGSYVTLLGHAELIRDPMERSRWWKEEWANFYQDRNRGDDYLLIRIRPFRLEISSERHGIRNDSVTWRPTIVEIP